MDQWDHPTGSNFVGAYFITIATLMTLILPKYDDWPTF